MNQGRIQNFEKRIQKSELSSKHIWAVIVVLLIIACGCGHSHAAEPNKPAVAVDPNLIKSGDGFTLGFSLRGSSGSGQGKELLDIGYTYGVAQFYLAGDVSEQKYFEGAVEFESRDIAEDKSVYGLSTLLLMFTPESYQVTGVAGFGYALVDSDPSTSSGRGEDNHGLTIGGINVRFNEDKNLCLTGRVVTALDGDSEIRVGLRIKF